jgi:phage gp16-like protein
VAREGVTAVTWQRVDVEERMKWPSEFISTFRILQLYVLGAQTTLSQLSHLVSAEAEKLKLTTSEYSMEELVRYRNEMHNLVAWTTQLSLLHVNDECGGTSDHHAFYHECRAAFNISTSYSQLSLGVDALMKIMDHLYQLTKQMVQSEKMKREKLRDAIKEKRRVKDEDRFAEVECRKKGIEVSVGMVSAVALPAAVTTSFFGMNLSDLPLTVSYQNILIGCSCAALTFLLIFISIICLPRRFCCQCNTCTGFRNHHGKKYGQIQIEEDEEDLVINE